MIPASLTMRPIRDLLPHAGPAVLLDEIVGWLGSPSDSALLCRARLGPAHPYMRDGQVEPIVSLEMMAQAAALYASLNAQAHAEPTRRPGLLIAVTGLSCASRRLTCDDVLEVGCRCTEQAEQAARFVAAVTRRGERVAEATLTVAFQPKSTGPMSSSFAR